MKSSKDAGFILTLVAIGALVAVGAYFLLIAPTFAAITEANEAEEAASAFNDTLEIQLAQYKADFEKLPETRAEIATIQTEFSQQEDVASVRRQIEEILAAESLRLDSDNMSIPVVVTPGTQFLGPAAIAVGRVSYTDALVFQNLYVTTTDLEFTGPLDNIIRAIARLQMNDERYFLVSRIEATEDAEAADGTYNARIQVQFFTLLDPTGAVDPGTNSGNFDPETGEQVPDTPPGSALRTTPAAPVVTPSPSPGTDDDEEDAEG